jgi:hypothetical protein
MLVNSCFILQVYFIIDDEYVRICKKLMQGLRKNTKDLSDDSQSADGDLNPGFPEYEVRVVICGPRRSVHRCFVAKKNNA